mmetsp:Transcript_26092/g.46342  ORF Transcript_26092/g.46342 Transcript_26092/m.46342 type:complete len:450 (-) Transcript_26092:5562-6911(-)
MAVSAEHRLDTDSYENKKLKAQIERLESNLSLNKQILFETLQARIYGSGSGDSTTAPQVSSRITEKLLYENEIMQSRVSNARLQAIEAQNKLEKLDKSIRSSQEKELKIERDYMEMIEQLKVDSALKEKEVQAKEQHNRALEEQAYEYQKGREEAPVTPLEAITFLQDKREKMKAIVINLREDLDKEAQHRDELLVKFKNLAEDYKISCSLLNSPEQDFRYLEAICMTQEDRLNFDEWWGLNFEESVFSSLESSLEDLDHDILESFQGAQLSFDMLPETMNSHMRVSMSPKDAQEKKLNTIMKGLKKRLADAYVKQETLNVELMNLKRMSGLLYDDNNILKASVARAHAKYRAVKAKLAHGRNLEKHLEEVEPKSRRRKKGRCISNPLEYTEQQGLPIEVISTAHDRMSEDEVSFHPDQPVSDLPSVIQQNISDDSFQGDSVLLDVFSY